MANAESIRAQDYANVTSLLDGGMRVGEALLQVSAQRGATRAAVSANYYSARRGRGSGRRKARTARATAARRAPTRAGGGARVDATTAELVHSVQELAGAVKAQEAELTELRTRLEGVRRLLG